MGKNLFLKASLPALYICHHFFSYQAPLDTLRYWLLSDSLVSSPGWTRPAPSASAHKTSASAPLVAPTELPTGCLCLSWWGAEEGKTGCRTPHVISLPSICWLSNSGCSWPSLLPGYTAEFPNTFFFPEYYQCYSQLTMIIFAIHWNIHFCSYTSKIKTVIGLILSVKNLCRRECFSGGQG